MSSTSRNTTLSFRAPRKKNNFRRCPTCLHLFSDSWNEVILESELVLSEEEINARILEEPSACRVQRSNEDAAQAGPSSVEDSSDESEVVCLTEDSELTASAEQHAIIEQATSYIDTKEDQVQTPTCVEACPYEKWQMERDPDAEPEKSKENRDDDIEEARKDCDANPIIDIEMGQRPFRIYLPTGLYRKENGGTGHTEITISFNPARPGVLKFSFGMPPGDVEGKDSRGVEGEYQLSSQRIREEVHESHLLDD